MQKLRSDFFAGSAVVAGVIIVVGLGAGIGHAFVPLYLYGAGVLVLRLLRSKLAPLAIILLPAILLRHLLPRSLRLAVAALPAAADVKPVQAST